MPSKLALRLKPLSACFSNKRRMRETLKFLQQVVVAGKCTITRTGDVSTSTKKGNKERVYSFELFVGRIVYLDLLFGQMYIENSH